jgi:hypothetical protein
MTRMLTTWQRLLLLALTVFGIGQICYWAVVTGDLDKPLDTVCATWDRDVSAGIALLVPDPTALAESHLDDALFRLRRARRNCRAGWLDIARQDYEHLRESYPFPGHSVVDASPRRAD